MYILRTCTVYLILLFDIREFLYRFDYKLVEVSAIRTRNDHTGWINLSYYRQGVEIPVGPESGNIDPEFRNVGETHTRIFTRRINVDTTYSTKSAEIHSRFSASNTPVSYRASAIENGIPFTEKLVGCNKKWAHKCGRKKINEKDTLKSSQTVTAVTLESNISFQEDMEKDGINISPSPTTKIELQNSDKNTESSSLNDSVIITTSQDSDMMSKESIRRLPTGADNTTVSSIFESRTKPNLITNISFTFATSYISNSVNYTTPGTKSNFVHSNEPPPSNYAKKSPLAQVKKKAKKYLSSEALLRMTIKLDNATLFYPGFMEDNPFHRGNQIILNDPALKDLRTYFLLKSEESNGNAYADSLENCEELQTIQCMVNGLTSDIIYTGWHRWKFTNSGETSELICEANTTTSGDNTDSVTFMSTKYQLWYGSEQTKPGSKYMLGLQPSVTGLYMCIAVDANYNVLLTSYLDIRIVTVVTAKNASITPLNVQIYTNDTQESFIFNHCRGYISPASTENVWAAPTVYFFNLDDSNVENASFTVNYLHEQTWNLTERLFENLDLNSPMLLRCQFTFSSNSNIYKSFLELYFRHQSAKNRAQKTFTAVVNETLNFSCKGLVSRTPVTANASYFEGNCSENKPVYRNSNGSNITLTINKQVCLVCSLYTSQIKLQINTEDDYRTQTRMANNTNEHGDCSTIWDMPTKLFTVHGSSNCEEISVALLKETVENRNKTITFQPFTYKVYYTSRQFVVCQSKPMEWSSIETQSKSPTSNDDPYFLKVIAGVLSTIIALLMFLVWRKILKGKQQGQDVPLNSIHTRHLLTQRPSYEKAFASDELEFANPGEHIEQSKISIGSLLGSGKFGRVFKADVKCKSLLNMNGILEVAVKELKAHSDNNTHNMGTVNEEIQIMRMIVPHLNIIRYFGYSLGAESKLLIMELAKGPSLLQYLHEQRVQVPGFVLRMNFQSLEIKHTLVRHTISGSSYSNVAYSHDFFELQDKSLPRKERSTPNSIHTVYSDNEVLETVENQQRYSTNCIDCISVSSAPDHDEWSVEYEDSNTERSVEELTEQYSSEWSRRSSSAIESMSKEIFSICRQVARGMGHIASLNIIHRDLAARNIVLASRTHPLVVKICDFGMAHNLLEGEIIYKEDSFGPRPFRWMSPEALNKGEFSVYSDIWSYGVVCWEVITLGSYPFGKMPNFAVAAKVAAGHYLPRPSNCESEIYAILKSCWKIKPPERSSFESLECRWSDILEANSDYIELQAGELANCE